MSVPVRRRPVLAALAALGLTAAACTGDDSPSSSSPSGSTGAPTATDAPADAPFLGASQALLPDPGGDGVLLLSGPPEETADEGPMQLWRWDGDTWSVVDAPEPAPSARNFFSATYDDGRDVIVLFGGDTASGASDETWEWDGAAWRSFDAAGPGSLMSASLTFDPASRLSVLYGGNDDVGEPSAETWGWDGSGWTRLAARGPEPTRWPAAMVADTARDAVVLYGGHQVVDVEQPAALGDTWQWDGRSWKLRVDPSRPGPLVNAQALAHPQLGILLVGGSDMARASGDVWHWDGDQWLAIAQDVFPQRQAFGLAYDAARDVIVLTGGVVRPGALERYQDVWEWSGDPNEKAVRVDQRPPA